jgi:hypothetical protein
VAVEAVSPREQALGIESTLTLTVRSPGKEACRGFTTKKKQCSIPVSKQGSGYCYLHGRQALGKAASPAAALVLREAAEREGVRSARKEAEARAAAMVSSRKARVFVRVRGIASLRHLQSHLSDMVRDFGVRTRKEELKAKLGEGAFYTTRARAHKPRHTPTDHNHLEMDHVLECQMLGHAIVQTEAFHEGGWLQAVELHNSRTQQPSGVVKSTLEGLYGVQNCCGAEDDGTFFNLRLLDKSLNITKGGVVKNWLDGRYAGGEAAALTGLRAGFRQSTAVRANVISVEEGEELAAALRAAMAGVEAPYLQRLEGLQERPPATAATLSERTAHANRYAGLMETIQLLMDELESID